jgi:hypothetical protein
LCFGEFWYDRGFKGLPVKYAYKNNKWFLEDIFRLFSRFFRKSGIVRRKPPMMSVQKYVIRFPYITGLDRQSGAERKPGKRSNH